MKHLMLGACLAAVAGAPVFAQPYDQDQPDPYYDQGQPPPSQPPSQPYGPGGGYDQNQPPAQPPSGYQPGGGDQDENGYGQQEGGAYQPPPAPPPGQPGFQVYQGNPQYQPQPGYQGGYGAYGQYPAPQYGYQGGYGQPPAYRSYGGATGAHFTGRVGSRWRNDQGQLCVWRELTWQDQSGRPAYRWVERCRS